MTSLVDAAAHLFLGALCPGCRTPARSLCQRCARALAASAPHMVQRPGLGVPVMAAQDYRPLLEHVVPAHKDDGGLHLSRPLGLELARAVTALGCPAGTVLVPMPSVPAVVRRRGMDHARRIVGHAARRTRLRWLPLLRRVGAGADQRGLTRGSRQRNVAGSMVAHARRGFTVVVCDDVVTTGASLTEAVEALLAAGHDVWGGAVIADADRFRAQVGR